MLNRRIQEYAAHDLICIGTRATLTAGDEPLDKQREPIGEVAQNIFG
jgi:hypothetical protein